jgi:hypothetical protein
MLPSMAHGRLIIPRRGHYFHLKTQAQDMYALLASSQLRALRSPVFILEALIDPLVVEVK